MAEKLIAECKEVDKLRQQYNLFHDFVIENKQLGSIELEYFEPYGNSYGVYIKVNKYVMEIVFKPMEKPEKNEIRTKFYLDVDGLYKSFMIGKEAKPSEYVFIQNKRRDYYPTAVRWENWGDVVIKAIKTVEENPQRFLLMCESSCPYNNDGTHKFKSWKTKAKVEVSYDAHTGVIQGVKKGETPSGAHIVGGNGSFRYWDKRTYVLKYTVDSLACEKPLKFTKEVDVDEFLRALKERVGRKNLPYELLNSKLNEKIGVITTDMDKDPEDRDFYPVDYDHDWLKFLDESFKDL